MGEIKISIDVENFTDRFLFLEGQLPENKIRHHSMPALVDTGAVMLVLPQDVVDKLGLKTLRKVIVTYADERKDERPVAGTVTLKIGDRFMNTDCVVGPPLSEPLIGQVVMETLDLVADCQNQTLDPRPDSPVYPSLKMK